MRPGEQEQAPNPNLSFGLLQVTSIYKGHLDHIHPTEADLDFLRSISDGTPPVIGVDFEAIDNKIRDFADHNGLILDDSGDFDCDQTPIQEALEIEDEVEDTGTSRRGLFETLRKSIVKQSRNAIVEIATDSVATESVVGPENKAVHADSGEVSRRGLLLGLVAAGVTVYAVNQLKNWSPFKERTSELFETQPPKVESKARPETFEIQGFFNMAAAAKVGVAVDINGFKEGLGIDFTGITDAEMDKVLFCDYLLATDMDIVNTSLVIRKEQILDDNGNVIGFKNLGARAQMNAFDIFHPRVNIFDYRNAISLRTGDSLEEMNKKIEEFVTQHGKHYDTTGGFDCGACSTSASELFYAANLAAMLTIAVDGRQPEIFKAVTEKYTTNMRLQLAVQLGLRAEDVQIDVVYEEGMDPNVQLTDEQIRDVYKKRLNDMYEEYFKHVTVGIGPDKNQTVDVGDILFEVKPELRTTDNGDVVYTKLHGGAEITIPLSGMEITPEIHDLIIKEIQEFETQIVNPDGSLSDVTEINNTNKTLTTTNTLPITVTPTSTKGPEFDPQNNGATQTTAPVYGPVYNPQPVTSTTRPVYGPPFPGNTTSTTQG